MTASDPAADSNSITDSDGSVRVIVVDDHPIVRAGVTMVLGIDATIEVVAEGSNGLEAVELAGEHRPDVVLMDLQMPELDGVGATEQIRAQLPDVHVLVLTTYDTDQAIVNAVEAGAAGYLLKDAPPAELLAAIKAVARGETILPPEIAARLMAKMREPKLPDLTARELDVLRCVATGASNPTVAKELVISLATVKTHLIHIYQKLQVDDRTSAVTKGIELGLIEL